MIRIGQIQDLENAYNVILDAKRVFKEKKSSQWQDLDGYPNLKTLEDDIKRNELYVFEENNQIDGIFVLSLKEEECYKAIYDGKWLTDFHYMTLHRIAIYENKRHQGISEKMMNFIFQKAKEENYHSIRVDTMENNIEMNNLLIKSGFVLCGKINLLRKDVLDKMRLAYEKKL